MTQDSAEVFSGPMSTSYRQMYVMSAVCNGLMPDESGKNHVNGLCGGAVADGLFLTVGIHTGNVLITVEIHETAPPVDDAWEEIVEASCCFSVTPIFLYGWAGDSAQELPLRAGRYRARFCAKAFGASEDEDDDEESAECYLLAFWPEAPRPDLILKQTSPNAIYWHEARKRPI